MSINITVAGNPLNSRPRRTVLSDFEQIKKGERERRKRLRLEQVRQKSKDRSSQILERAKLIEQHELDKLKNDKDCELHLLHAHRLQRMQDKYREDMENIGQAHMAAAQQPNVDDILEANRERYRIAAEERGREATRRLREETKQKQKERDAAKSRMRSTRESENIRAAMISQLPRIPCNEDDETTSGLSENEENIDTSKSKNVRRVTAMVHQENNRPKVGKHVVVDASDARRTIISCESDDQEPRRTVPIPNSPILKAADRIASYNPEDYRQPTSDDSTITSSINQDSPQSTTNGIPLISRMPRSQTVPSSNLEASSRVHTVPSLSQVHMYDLSSRKENQYPMSSKVVERVDRTNGPNAEDQAKELTRSESYISQLSVLRKKAAENRGKDALLREKVRRDYDQLLRSLDHYCTEERKLKASRVENSPTENVHMHPRRKKECLKKRQQKMERNIESVMRKSQPSTNFQEPTLPPERVITLPKYTPEAPSTSRQPQVISVAAPPGGNLTLHYEQILEMLMRLERTKYKLWLEYGSSLPESISNATQRPIWQEQLTALLGENGENAKEKAPEQPKPATPASPEVRVINVSLENEAKKKKKREKEKAKVAPKLSEMAVQTSLLSANDDAQDKSVQVEMSREREQLSREIARSERHQHVLEPSIKVVAQTENVDSGSSVSTVTDIVIDVDEQHVKVTPKRKHKRPRLSVVTRRSLTGKGSRKSPHKSMKNGSKSSLSPVKETVDKATSPRTETDSGTQISCNSTEISQVYSANETPKEAVPYVRNRQNRRIYKLHRTSDSSTSYASPPDTRIGTHLPLANTSTPVLEILDSSRSATEKIRRSGVSPVSSPETPSPRTMKLASNVRHAAMSKRAPLKRSKQSHAVQAQDWGSWGPTGTSAKNECQCTNPSCRLFHNKPIFDDQSEEINKKYEEFQIKSKGKIASLTELLDKLRSVDSLLLSEVPPADTTAENIQVARNLVAQIEEFNDKLKRNLIESQKLVNNHQADLSSAGPLTSTPLVANNVRGDNQALDLPALNKPKIISDKRIVIDQSEPTNANGKDEMLMRLMTEFLRQNENREKVLARDSDNSSDKQIEKLSVLQLGQMQNSEELSFEPVTNGKSYNGRKVLPFYKELSTIKEFDTPDTGMHSLLNSTTFKLPPSAKSKRASSTPCTSTPTRAVPENKSTQVAASALRQFDNADSSSLDQPGESSSSAASSDNKRTTSDLSGFSGISKIDSQNSIEKQLFEKVSWAGATVKKTRESAALDSSSTSDAVPPCAAQRPLKKYIDLSIFHEFSGFTDVSSISLKNTNRSTEPSVLQKARTSTPNLQSSGTTDCSGIATSPSMELT